MHNSACRGRKSAERGRAALDHGLRGKGGEQKQQKKRRGPAQHDFAPDER